MKEEGDFVDDLFHQVSKRINKPVKQFAPFVEEMKKNWYDTPQSIKDLTDAQYQKMGIPLRVVTAIRQQINVMLNLGSEGPKPQPDNKNRNIPESINTTNKNTSQPKLTEATMLDAIRKMQTELIVKYQSSKEQALKIFQTLLKIIKNIITDPYELKFRVLKKSNNKIRQIIFNNDSVLTFLKRIGFQEDEETISLHKFEVHQLYFIDECLQTVINNQKFEGESNANKKVKKSEKRQDFFLPADIKFPQNKESSTLQKQFSKERLQEANYADVLEQLVAYRNQLMSTPPKNRKIRIYHKRYEVKEVIYQSFNVEESIQSSSNKDSDMFRHIKDLLAQSKKNSNFQSRRKTEFEFLVKQKVYREAIIKVRLPNQFIIEARFGPLQTLSAVFQLIATIVIGDIYMFQTPPVKRLDKDMKRTLVDLDSVPHGSFYLGINSEWYIKNQYLSIVQK